MLGILLALTSQATTVSLVTHASLPSPISHYISPLDYPAEAIPQRAEGRVELTLAIDATGRLTACTVRKSSGWPVLDAATCRILLRRAKFNPARDAFGHPMSDVIETGIDWHMPPPDLLRHLAPRG